MFSEGTLKFLHTIPPVDLYLISQKSSTDQQGGSHCITSCILLKQTQQIQVLTSEIPNV